MKYYLYSIVLILATLMIVLAIPLGLDSLDGYFLSLQVPQNNSSVAGIQKYNLPPVGKNIVLPELTARAILVKDLGTGTILYQKNADIAFPIASTTKIMTALVASEFFKQNTPLTVHQGANIIGATVGLKDGEDLSFRSILYGMLLNSGNDAAYALAENYQGGVLGFVSAMNKKAMELNLSNTHFDNPAGFDSPNHYSSASDMAKITEEALKNEQLAKIFATKETEIVSLDKKYTHQLQNLNKLLAQVKGVLGVKTGYTEEAKENLVTYVSRDNHQILTVILGSDDRFGESTQVIEWAYQNFVWSN